MKHIYSFLYYFVIFYSDSGCISTERLLVTGIPQMEWYALPLHLNPIENLWDQLSRRVEARNSATQKLNHLRAALQEEWDAILTGCFHFAYQSPA
uniref:Tc1-like transposase DDE domain-containing protein n=1 Tax=Salarias fasciatus TaxID=181472 RepID=A0A672JLN0_SALFA